jgi:hypothetical protein
MNGGAYAAQPSIAHDVGQVLAHLEADEASASFFAQLPGPMMSLKATMSSSAWWSTTHSERTCHTTPRSLRAMATSALSPSKGLMTSGTP